MAMLSLQKQSLLSIACHVSTYSADCLALIPPRLRTIIALNLSAADLHRVEQCPSFLEDLRDGIDSEKLWKRRYETTLMRFSNVASLNLDLGTHHPTLSLSWKDRYLLACIMNIPHVYSEGYVMSLSPLGLALFGLTDICLPDGDIIKELVGTTKYGLKCIIGRGESRGDDNKITLSANFVSEHYLLLLSDSTTSLSQCVGAVWPLADRIKLFSHLFPGWVMPYIPVQYDEITSPIPICMKTVQRTIVYSGWYETRRSAEINEDDERPLTTSDSFKRFFDNHSGTLDTVILLAPAVQKFRLSSPPEYLPLSISTTKLASVVSLLPTLNHLSISMHYADISCLDMLPQLLPPLYHCLQTLHLKVVRPKFDEPCVLLGRALGNLYQSSRSFKDLILQGLPFDDKGFKEFMLAFLNTPPSNDQLHHSVVLRNIKICPTIGDEESKELEKQVMPEKCRYTKSLYVYRMLNSQSLYQLLSAYDNIYMDRLSFSSVQDGNLTPSSLTIHANTVRLEQTTLDENRLKCVQPALTGDIVNVELSLGSAFPFSNYNECIRICMNNLRYLGFNSSINSARTLLQLETLFVTIFSLPPDTLSNLELNLCHLINNFASYLATKDDQINTLSLWSQINHRKDFQSKHLISIYKCLSSTWLTNANGVKLKRLFVPMIAFEELYDQLTQLAITLTDDI